LIELRRVNSMASQGVMSAINIQYARVEEEISDKYA